MMDGSVLAKEVLEAMGGEVNATRSKAFEDFCTALVKHIQTRAQVTVVTTCPAGGGSGAGAPGTAIQ